MRRNSAHGWREWVSIIFASVVLAGTALSGVLVGPAQQARAALVATGVPDTATVKHDRTLVTAAPGVLRNDLNLLGGSTSILVSGVSHGSLDLRSDGGFTYVPDSGYVGTDSFRYRPSGLLSTAAQVTITITNAAPVATPDAYTWPAGTTLGVAAPGVLANDTDADGDELTAELAGGSISGSFNLEEDGGLSYTPGGGFPGSGTVSYRVWDGLAWSAPTTISLTRLSPTPTPTPQPTPTPTPRPTPTPNPLPLPLPSLPVPLPLPPIGPPPGPGPEPTDPPSSSTPRPSAEPSIPGADDPKRPRAAGDGEDAQIAPPPSFDDFGGSGGAPEEIGAPAVTDGPGIAVAEPRFDLGSIDVDLLAGVEIWSVPAATLGVPGLLLLIWVGLQGLGGLVWIPAVKRLRGDEDAMTRPAQ